MWVELILTSAYFCNRMPHSGLDIEIPFKCLYGNEVDVSHLNTIGAGFFVHIKDDKTLKPKS